MPAAWAFGFGPHQCRRVVGQSRGRVRSGLFDYSKNKLDPQSRRGLAVTTASAEGEEFPRFVEFWIERPRPGAVALTIYGLLDSKRIAGAYRFVLAPGNETVMAVTSSGCWPAPSSSSGNRCCWRRYACSLAPRSSAPRSPAGASTGRRRRGKTGRPRGGRPGREPDRLPAPAPRGDRPSRASRLVARRSRRPGTVLGARSCAWCRGAHGASASAAAPAVATEPL